MTKVEELERAVSELNRDQLAAFRRWFVEFDAELWDRRAPGELGASCGVRVPTG